MKRLGLCLGLACALGCACDSRTESPRVRALVPTHAGAEQAMDSAAACAGCHATEVVEWRASQHQASFVSPDFQRSYRAEHLELCADCHAPLRTPGGARDTASGIGCNACHVVGEGHLARGTSDRPRVTTKACASCHDFDVPGTRVVLQSTAREHAVSAFAGTSCTECHMEPRAHGLRDHRFDVSRNKELLSGSIRVQSTRFSDGVVLVDVAASGVGHRFPTGDIFRRLTLTLTAITRDGGVIAGDTIHLGRDWDGHRASQRAGATESALHDTRLTDVPRELRLTCTVRPDRVHLTVNYERGASAEGEFFESFGSIEIYDADVPLEAPTAQPASRAETSR